MWNPCFYVFFFTRFMRLFSSKRTLIVKLHTWGSFDEQKKNRGNKWLLRLNFTKILRKMKGWPIAMRGGQYSTGRHRLFSVGRNIGVSSLESCLAQSIKETCRQNHHHTVHQVHVLWVVKRQHNQNDTACPSRAAVVKSLTKVCSEQHMNTYIQGALGQVH